MLSGMRRLVCLGEGMIEIADGADGAKRMFFGGDVMNTAVYASRSGLRVVFASALGIDPYSDEMLTWLASESVETELVARDKARLPGLYLIRNRPDGERDFHYWRSDSAARAWFMGGAASDLLATLGAGDALYLSGVTLSLCLQADHLAEAAVRLRARGGTVIFDTNYRPRGWPDIDAARRAIRGFAPVVDVALPTFEDEAALFCDADPEATARRWRDFGASEVAVKRGADGALIDAADFRGWVRPLREVRPVDTTGAGDSFNGAYIAARVVNGAAAAAAAAHRLAAAVISRRGAIIPHDAMPLAEAAAC